MEKAERKTATTPKKKQPASFENVYPPIDGWGWSLSRNNHSGYISNLAIKCECGASPVFEQYCLDLTGTAKSVPAKLFVGICPNCGLRAIGQWPLEKALAVWNSGERTADSRTLAQKCKNPDNNACKNLSDAAVTEAVEEAVRMVRRKNELQTLLRDDLLSDQKREVYYIELKSIRSNLRSLQVFFTESPLLYDKDSDAVLSGIRKILYPGLSYEDRIKIPLKLVSM